MGGLSILSASYNPVALSPRLSQHFATQEAAGVRVAYPAAGRARPTPCAPCSAWLFVSWVVMAVCPWGQSRAIELVKTGDYVFASTGLPPAYLGEQDIQVLLPTCQPTEEQ